MVLTVVKLSRDYSELGRIIVGLLKNLWVLQVWDKSISTSLANKHVDFEILLCGCDFGFRRSDVKIAGLENGSTWVALGLPVRSVI